MLSNSTKNTIANICYANILGQFASFHAPNMQGSKFTWENFPHMCTGWTYTWLITNYHKKITPEILTLAYTYTWEISSKAVSDAGYAKLPWDMPQELQDKLKEDIKSIKMGS